MNRNDSATRIRENATRTIGLQDSILQNVRARMISAGISAVPVVSLDNLKARPSAAAPTTEEIGSAIDARIAKTGKAEHIAEMSTAFKVMKSAESAVASLREELERLPASIGAGVLVPVAKSGKALDHMGQLSAFRRIEAIHDALSASVSKDVELTARLPALPFARIGVQSPVKMPFQNTPSQAALRANTMLGQLVAFEKELGSRDIEACHLYLWQNRAAACESLGLANEAKAAVTVVEQLVSDRDRTVRPQPPEVTAPRMR